MTTKDQPKTLEELRELLSNDIELDLERFGKDGYRPLSKLLEELGANDVRLEFKDELGASF